MRLAKLSNVITLYAKYKNQIALEEVILTYLYFITRKFGINK